jgi:GNAT superfamily N-acetyltransferase
LIRVVSMELFVWAGGDLGDAYCSLPLEIRRGSASDLDRLCSFLGARPGGRQVGLVEQRLSLGDMPYLAFSHGNLAHVAWVCRRPEVEVTEVWGSLALGPDAAYAMDCRTSLLFRGQGIYPAVLQHIVQDMATEGATRVVVACESGNRASWKGIEKAGFVRVRRVLAIKLLGLRLGSGRISTEALAAGP